MDLPERPPRRLPAGLHELWRALRRAQEEAGNRAELGRRLGVSTHTLQRLLVDGDVPRFTRGASKRQSLAWAKTITRVAHRLGGSPRAWVEAAGIPWTDEVAEVSRRASIRRTPRQVPSRRPLETGVRDGARGDPWAAIRRARFAGVPGTVEVGFVDLPPFTDASADGSGSFFVALTRRWIDSLDPSLGIRPRVGSAVEILDALADPTEPIHLAVGLFESSATRSRGLRFLAIPGWKIGLAAIRARRAPEPNSSPGWRDLSRPGGRDTRLVLVEEGNPGEAHVRSAWPDAVTRTVGRRSLPPEIAEEILAAMDSGSREVVFVADESTAHLVSDLLGRSAPSPISIREIRAPEDCAPRFDLGVGAAPHARTWSRLLREALVRDLFGASRAFTARLYARLSVAAAHRIVREHRIDGFEVPSYAQPVHFARANQAFQAAYSREVLDQLWDARGDLVPAFAPNDDPSARAEAFDRISAIAHGLIPPEWRASLDEESWRARRTLLGEAFEPSAAPPHCRSCSQSLREHPGLSSHYCRYCSDETGRLRPREEVHELIARWMESWQPQITREEARRRATLYMSAMPAWSDREEVEKT